MNPTLTTSNFCHCRKNSTKTRKKNPSKRQANVKASASKHNTRGMVTATTRIICAAAIGMGAIVAARIIRYVLLCQFRLSWQYVCVFGAAYLCVTLCFPLPFNISIGCRKSRRHELSLWVSVITHWAKSL